MKPSCALQACTHLFTHLLNCRCSHFRKKKNFVQHCFSFAKSSAFSFPSVTNFSKCDISLLSFFVRCALTCSTSTEISFETKRCSGSQILIRKSASPALGSMHFLSPLHSPSIIPPLSTCTLMGPIAFLRRQRNAVSSALFMVRWDLEFCFHRAVHPVQGRQFIRIQLHHRPATCSPLPSNIKKRAVRGNVARKPFCWHAQLLRFSDSHFFKMKRHLFHWLSLSGCVTIPLCHFHSSFEVLAFCSPLSEGLRNIPPYCTIPDSGRACAFLCLPPWDKLGIYFRMSKSLFCTRTLSRNNFLATFRCFSVHSSFVFFRSRAKAGSSQIPSINSSFSCFPAHILQQFDLACPNNIFFTSFGQTCLVSTLTCPSKIRVCHCGHLMPKFLVSHMTAASHLTCLHV